MNPRMQVPNVRIRALHGAPTRDTGRYVLYWMIAARRATENPALDRAVELANEHGVGVVVCEALRVGYRWASDRLHAFVLEGMAQNAQAFASTPIEYHPYVEPEAGAGRGLIEALARDAVAVVTDEYPCFFLPRMVASTARKLDVSFEAVDGIGLMPLRSTERVFTTAFSLRAHLQKVLPEFLRYRPLDRAWAESELPAVELASEITTRWPRASDALLAVDEHALGKLPIDHSVARSSILTGGAFEGERVLERFLAERLARYGEHRNDPEQEAASGLSPYLHFGHVGAHQVVFRVLEEERWNPSRLGKDTRGSRNGWWGTSASAEAFLDELVTWRELGPNFCYHRPDDYDAFESLPDFAQTTLAEHAEDERTHVYDLATLERAETHDEVWNAAQRQLVREGRMHNYLRMLWGKNVLAWSETPRQALDVLIHLNNKYALDGRDPNSYSGIFWTLGRYDRAWGPERPIFGKIRYMTSANTKRKLKLTPYLHRYAPP